VPDLSIPAEFAIRIPQNADWPGDTIPIYDATGAARTSLPGCTAAGAIRDKPGGTPLYLWSTSPAAGQGQITFVGGSVTFSVPAAHSALWTWRFARWLITLTDPNAPPGQQTIWVGHGPAELVPS
jgi:hypothetical protein